MAEPWLRTMLRGIRHSSVVGAVLVLIGACVSHERNAGVAYFLFYVTAGLGILISCTAAIRREYAYNNAIGQGLCHPDRSDLALFLCIMGWMAGTGLGVATAGAQGSVLGLVGAMLGGWMLSSHGLTIMLMLGLVAYAAAMEAFFQVAVQSSPQAWLPVLGACLGLILAAGLLKSLLRFAGPPGFLRTFVALAVSLALPVASGADDCALGVNVALGAAIWYVWWRGVAAGTSALSEPSTADLMLTAVAVALPVEGIGHLARLFPAHLALAAGLAALAAGLARLIEVKLRARIQVEERPFRV